MRIVVVGTGYVGLVTGVCLAEVGHHVTCVDLDKSKVDTLKGGTPTIFEPGLETLLKRNISHERLQFSTSLGDSLEGVQVVFIAVGTPQDEDGSADLQHVRGVAGEIGRIMTEDLIVVVKSTVPVGTCDIVESVLMEELQGRQVGARAVVASNPEFLKEGDAIDDFMRPDRIIVGVEDSSVEPVFEELYRPFIMDNPGRLFIMDRHSSELTKYGANAMLATRISFMNELAKLCEIVGANIDHVRRGMGADPRIGRKFLYAGPGFGGSCFPKDVYALLKTAEDQGLKLQVLKAVKAANDEQKRFVANKVQRYFGNLKGKRLALWGLAFKPGTDDVREAPAKVIIETLISGGASVVCHDPEATSNFKRDLGPLGGVSYVDTAYEALAKADALILVTEWSEYKRPNWEKAAAAMNNLAVFDLRNQYDYKTVSRYGFHYECIGRPSDDLAQSAYR